MDVNKNHWQFLAETPFKINGYGIFEISSSGESEQLFSVDSSHKIYRNSSTNAKYLPINIIGTTMIHLLDTSMMITIYIRILSDMDLKKQMRKQILS